MKRILLVLSLLILSGCGTASEEAIETNERFTGGSPMSGSRVITDSETGCRYLYHKSANAGGLSPLYKANGEIDCGS